MNSVRPIRLDAIAMVRRRTAPPVSEGRRLAVSGNLACIFGKFSEAAQRKIIALHAKSSHDAVGAVRHE